MLFGNRPLRQVTERDVRDLLAAGMREHLQLEYKSTSYEQNDTGRREFLQDICMFANAAGGVLLIGVTESRGDDGQPSGAPDPDAALGVASPNPDAVLLACDAQIVACIEDRLAVEAYPIPVGEGRFVLAFRVPSSVRKPHCVRLQHRKYFPARRERNRYEMDLREIKEQTLRAASQLERAQHLIQRELDDLELIQLPHLFVTQVPVFSRDFSVDITQENIVQRIQQFDVRTREARHYRPDYTFVGLQRHDPEGNTDVLLRRNGMLTLKAQLPGREVPGANQWRFALAGLDILLHEYAVRAQEFYRTAELDSPAILSVAILTRMELRGLWNRDHGEGRVPVIQGGRFVFPFMEVGDPVGDDVDRIIRPICDQIHQMFGRERSEWFDVHGHWRDPREGM